MTNSAMRRVCLVDLPDVVLLARVEVREERRCDVIREPRLGLERRQVEAADRLDRLEALKEAGLSGRTESGDPVEETCRHCLAPR